MAYYNYPATYQYQPYQQQNQNSIIWVQGEAGAKSYLVAPNTTVQLWDSESQTIFLKSADASGMPSMKVLDYTIRNVQNAPNQPVVATDKDYATKSDIEALRGQIDSLRMRIGKLSKKEAEDESAI